MGKEIITSRPAWCEEDEEDEGLEAASSWPEFATGMRSSRSLSLLAITIGDFSSPIAGGQSKRRRLTIQKLNATLLQLYSPVKERDEEIFFNFKPEICLSITCSFWVFFISKYV